MAYSIAEAVLNKLGSLAADQVGLLWGLKSEISKLETTVSSIQAVLLDAEEQSSHNHQVQLWVDRLKEVLYDAEDLLDDFSSEALLKRQQMGGNRIMDEVRVFFSGSNQVAYGLKLASEIKAIRSRLEQIDQSRRQFDFQMHPDEAAVVGREWRQTDSFAPHVFVGRAEDKQRIIDMLLAPSDQGKLAVIPILGTGGLGKTALAQLIYNDECLSSFFEIKVWVCVSENFDEKLLVKKILEYLTKEEEKNLELATLKHKLQEKIGSKKFLLVLDDVWDKGKYRSNWDGLKSFLWTVTAEGSRIIVTTRINDVAHLMATGGISPYRLKGLHHRESLDLFETIAFKGQEGVGQRWKDIGEVIVGRCNGVPLVIKAMAGLLSSKKKFDDWVAIGAKQALTLINTLDEERIVMATLRLSYDNLSPSLKRCFAYCSLFPKDHMIDVQMLVRHWIVHGFVKASQSSRLEDIGAEYFKILLSGSFFQDVNKFILSDNSEWCKMHDLMHDLASTVAGTECFSANVSNRMDCHLGNEDVNLEKTRHLSFDFEDRRDLETWQVPACLTKAKKLRTFLPLNLGGFDLKGEGCEMIFSNMIRLRALSVTGSFMIKPPSIYELKHLRYLDMSRNDFMVMIPDEISRLVNLQVLRLDWCGQLRRLPRGIVRLSNLEILGLDGCFGLTCMPAGIGKLTCLQELSFFIVGEEADLGAARISELKHLNNLRGELTIKSLERVKDVSEAEAARLKDKQHLLRLKLVWNSFSRGNTDDTAARCKRLLVALEPHENLRELLLYGYSGTSLPRWFSFLQNVVTIEMGQCGKLCSLPSLDPLVSLEELKLEDLDGLEYIQSGILSSSSSNSLFLSSLKSLRIERCNKLKGWSMAKTELPQLPCLSKLAISCCKEMVILPRFSMYLEEVEFMNVSSELLVELAACLPPPVPSSPETTTTHTQLFKSLSLCGITYYHGWSLPQALSPKLASLERLSIRRCAWLTTISAVIRHLTSLQVLEIIDCEYLRLEDDYEDDDDGNMRSLFLPNLRSFTIAYLPCLRNLPEWLQNCSNLQRLEIRSCGLMCFPAWLKKLTALESLEVSCGGCISLRCRNRTAENWADIAHIPNVKVDGR